MSGRRTTIGSSGSASLEDDPAVIAGAADRQMAHIRTFANGPRAVHTQALLNELAAAKLCLLDRTKKGAYDAALRSLFAQHEPRPSIPQIPSAAPPAPPPAAPPPAGFLPISSVKPAVPNFALQPTSPARAPAPVGREAESGVVGSTGGWMLLAAGLLLLFLVGGFAIVLIVLRERQTSPLAAPNAPSAPNNPPPMPPVFEMAPEPLVVHQEGDGSLNLSAASANLFGPKAELVERGDAAWLDGFASPEDRAEWRVQIARPGFFRIEATYAAAAEAAGGEWRLANDKQEKRVTIRDTGGKGNVVTETVGFIALPRSGRQIIAFEPLKLHGGQFLVLHKLRLIPRGS